MAWMFVNRAAGVRWLPSPSMSTRTVSPSLMLVTLPYQKWQRGPVPSGRQRPVRGARAAAGQAAARVAASAARRSRTGRDIGEEGKVRRVGRAGRPNHLSSPPAANMSGPRSPRPRSAAVRAGVEVGREGRVVVDGDRVRRDAAAHLADDRQAAERPVEVLGG